jgi:hypothetical protein
MPAWRLQADVVIFDGLRLRLHRIGRSHWRAAGVLRSWSAVPMHRDGDTLHAPCAPDEALWLGAWLADETVPAEVALTDAVSGRGATISPPGTFQIGGLAGADGALHPLVQTDAALALALRCGPASTRLALRLHALADWATLSARPAPEALRGPPPLPPRLG